MSTQQPMLYRSSALEHQSCPEQLDRLLVVTQPKSWMVLFAVFIIVCGIGVWSVLGSVPTVVGGTGILTGGGGVMGVQSTRTGQVTQMLVKPGDVITPGQVLVKIAQPELATALQSSAERVEEAKYRHEHLSTSTAANVELESRKLRQEESTLTSRIRQLRSQQRVSRKRLRNKRKLYERGLLTKDALDAAQVQLDAIRQEAGSTKARLGQLAIRQVEIQSSLTASTLKSEQELNEVTRAHERLSKELDRSTKVVSPTTGRVVELTTGRGEVIQPGMSVVTLEVLDDSQRSLEAWIYVSAHQGKLITEGMTVRLAPSTHKPEEYGYLLGRVTEVSRFPSTRQAMVRTLANEALVDGFLDLTGAAPIGIKVSLSKSESSPTPYQWTSSRDSNVQIQPGTLCSAKVTVREQKPIHLVLPFLKVFTGSAL